MNVAHLHMAIHSTAFSGLLLKGLIQKAPKVNMNSDLVGRYIILLLVPLLSVEQQQYTLQQKKEKKKKKESERLLQRNLELS